MELLLAAMLFMSTPIDSSSIMRKDGSLRNEYTVEVTLIGALQATRYSDKPTILSKETGFLGSNVAARLMWHPDHLLSVGLYSGFITFSRENLSVTDSNGVRQDITLDLTGYPAQAVVAMHPGHFQFGIGLGVYLLTTHTTVNNSEKFESSAYEYGASVWLGYDFELTKAFTLGPEIGLHVLSNIGITSATVGIRAKLDVLTY